MRKKLKKALLFSSLLLLATAAFYSCKKKHVPAPSYTTTVINNSLQKLNVKFYKSYTDYCNKTNAIVDKQMESNTNVTLTNTLQTGLIYYMDAYSDDFSFSNWGDYNKPAPFAVQIAANTDIKLADKLDSNYKRIIFLNGGDSVRTIWKAIDAYTYHQSILISGSSVWGQLTAAQQNKTMTVLKGYRAVCSYPNDTAGITNDTTSLMPDNTAYYGFTMWPLNRKDTVNFSFTGTQQGYIYNYYLATYNQIANDPNKVVCHLTGNTADTGILYIMQKQ